MESDQSRKIEFNRHNIMMALAGAAAVLIAVVIGSLQFNLRSGNSGIEDYGAIIEDEELGVTEDSDGLLTYDNIAYLKSLIGGDFIVKFNRGFSHIILEDKPVKAAENAIYTVKINNSSVKERIYYPYSVYTFELSTSDGREYQARIAVNGNNCSGVLLRRTSPDQSTPALYITADGYDYDARDDAVKGLITWAKSVYSGGIVVTTSN